MTMLKFCKLILILLIVAAIVVGSLVVSKYAKRYGNEKNIKEIVKTINEGKGEINEEIEGYQVIRNNKDTKN